MKNVIVNEMTDVQLILFAGHDNTISNRRAMAKIELFYKENKKTQLKCKQQ